VQLADTNIVLLGAFNSAIIEPSWLAAHDVIGQKLEHVTTEIQLFGATPNKTVFNLDGLRWEITNDRILIGSTQSISPAPWFGRLLDLLPHTPLRAVGINFKAKCSTSDWPIPVPALPNQDAIADLLGETVASSAISRSRKPDGTQLNLTLNANAGEMVFDANFHRGIAATEDQTIVDRAKQAMGEFETDLGHFGELVSRMTETELQQ
jgi:hypothetical protein